MCVVHPVVVIFTLRHREGACDCASALCGLRGGCVIKRRACPLGLSITVPNVCGTVCTAMRLLSALRCDSRTLFPGTELVRL